MTEITQTEDANHPLTFVDYRQPADLQLLHVPNSFGEIIILPAAMNAWRHDVTRGGALRIEVVLGQPFAMMSRSVTMPISWSFSPIGMAPMSCLSINLASSVTGVSGPTQSTPLCITSCSDPIVIGRLFLGIRIGITGSSVPR